MMFGLKQILSRKNEGKMGQSKNCYGYYKAWRRIIDQYDERIISLVYENLKDLSRCKSVISKTWYVLDIYEEG